MKKFCWRVQMARLLVKYGYSKNMFKAWIWTSREDWLNYYDEGYTPRQALDEDLSYA